MSSKTEIPAQRLCFFHDTCCFNEKRINTEKTCGEIGDEREGRHKDMGEE